MTKTVNPILSLAVVMALALAAVFGAMSLAGTAQANDHDETTTIYENRAERYDLRDLFTADQLRIRKDADGENIGRTFVDITGNPSDGLDDTAIAYVHRNKDGGTTQPDGSTAIGTPADAGYAYTTVDLQHAGLGGGYTSRTINITVTLQHGAADDPDSDPTAANPRDIERTLRVIVVKSVAAKLKADSNGDPVGLPDETLFTEYTSTIDVKSAFINGEGSGQIEGFMVADLPDSDSTDPNYVFEEPGNLKDEADDGTTSTFTDSVNVDANGMLELKGMSKSTAGVDHSVTAICRAIAVDTYEACMTVGASPAAIGDSELTIKMVAESMQVGRSNTQITPVDVNILASKTVSSADVMAAFDMSGVTGAGMVKEYYLGNEACDGMKSHLETVVFASINKDTGEVSLEGIDRGNTVVSVCAKDSLMADDLSISFVVRVREAVEREETVNTPALENGFIDNWTMTVGGAALRLDVRMYFTAGEGDGAITNYLFESSSPDKATVNKSSRTGRLIAVPVAAGTTVITVKAVDGNTADDPTQDFILTVLAADEAPTPDVFIPRAPKAMKDNPATDVNEMVDAYSFMATSDEPGDSARYDIKFAATMDVDTLNDELIIELEDFGFPSSVETRSIGITIDEMDGTGQDRQFSPETVTVDGEKLYITIGDMLTRDDDSEDFTISAGSNIDVVIRQNAEITIPTEAKMDDYGPVIELGSEPEIKGFENHEDYPKMQIPVLHYVKLDPDEGGLGEMVTAKGLGFKNGTSLTVFRDSDNNGILTSADNSLCMDPLIEGNIGTCQFEVTHPTFMAGENNHIDAVDGVNNTADKKSDVFTLEASISTSPKGGSPGERILVQVVDFDGSNVTKVTIGGEVYCDGAKTAPGARLCSGSINNQGSGNFSITIPNWARGGKQELKVWDDQGTSASTKIDLVGPQIRMTDQTVIANQRISLIGTGFSPGAAIANVDNLGTGHLEPVISIGGDPIDKSRINDGDPVRVDNGGNWSASVDLPLSEATTASGEREIRVRDSLSRTGVIKVAVKNREVTVTPDEGRVGTIALIQGTGFPSKNDEGSSFTVEIEYEAENGNTVTISALTDASGRFESQMRIPTTAAIPSSNQIHVRFDDDDDITVAMTVPHDVPEGVIMPSVTSGGPGSTISINGEGFKSFVPVALVKIGTLDVTPSPKPSTDGNGMMSFDIIIPGLDVGIQTIEVNVGRTTASVGFTVTESGVNPGDIKPVAAALEELGDNIVSAWNFNNDSKVWSFYDPTLAEGNTLTHMITGETYLIRVKSTTEVILNRDTRNLTCVGSNCWNQVVW